MNLKEIRNIQIALMKKDGNINEFNKAEYIRYTKAKFIISPDFFKNPDNFYENKDNEKSLEDVIQAMFNDLIKENVYEVDYLGIWVQTINNITRENAMSLENLESIKKYSKQDINPIFEFFKMTIQNG